MKTNDGTKIPSNNFKKGSPVKSDMAVKGMQSQTNQNLDDPGFDAEGDSIYKHGTPFGEGAKFNAMPPGPDISNQDVALINAMPLKTVTEMGYPGDGAFKNRDVPGGSQ